MSQPVLLFNETKRVCFQLPLGKLDKSGTLTVQHGQKGETCFFYAMKKILSEANIRSEHGKICSERRKRLTLTKSELPREAVTIRLLANELFFKAKGKTARDAWTEFKTRLESYSNPKILCQLEDQKTAPTPIKIADFLSGMDHAANYAMATGHNLKEVPYKNLFTIKMLIQTLQTKGPLLIITRISRFVKRLDLQPNKESLGAYTLYEGSRAILKAEPSFLSLHAIVLVGAEVKKGKEYIYWVDPHDASNPFSAEKQRAYVSDFSSFNSSLMTLFAQPIEEVKKKQRGHSPCAFYNPLFSFEK